MEGMNEEAELLLRLRDHDDGALRSLYERLGGNVFALSIQMLGSREDAEEVVQDTFVKVFDAAGRFDPERGSARAWIYTIARNECRMRLRARGSRPRTLGEVDPHEPDTPLTAPPREAGHVERITVQEAFAKLERDEVAMLRASFFQGYSHGEIAEATDTPLGTVKSRIRRALLKLRDFLEDG